MSEWKEYKLGDLCSKIGSGATPSGGKEAYKGGNYSLVRSQNILDFSFSYEGLAKINDLQAKKLANVELKERDVLLNITGDSVARACMVPTDILPARVNQHVAILRAKTDVLDSHFLLYYLQKQKKLLLQYASAGGTRNALTKGMIEDIIIKLPPIDEQKSIASILSSLDDKIAVNRRICENLEAQAQALFKNWFVDFAPFKNGKFVESELGMIPEGWRVGTLGEICVFQNGHAFKSKEFSDSGKYKLITIKGVQDGCLSIDGAVNIENVPSNMKNHCFLKEKDILLSLTGNVGRVCFVDQPNLLLNQRVAKIVPIPEVYWGFLYTFMRRKTTQNEMINLAKGTAQANLSPIETAQFKIALPAQEVVSDFSKVVNIMYQKMILLKQENLRLSTLRDTLLPKLMSGEILI